MASETCRKDFMFLDTRRSGGIWIRYCFIVTTVTRWTQYHLLRSLASKFIKANYEAHFIASPFY